MADVVINVGAVSAITAGTGLTGGTITGTGTIAASFGTSAGTICEGNDARLTAPVAPLAHASTHTAAGSDPLTLSQAQITNLGTDLAAKVAGTRQVIAGTGMGGGGALSADVTLNVSYGTSGTTACVGNDARLSNARTPSTHASTHSAGQSDAITITQAQVTSLVSDLAAKALGATTMTAGTGLTGGGDLTANRSFAVAYGTSSTTATVGNDSRLSFIASGTSATSRTLQNKLRDTVSVKDFGAVGDGSTNDTAAIQAALTAAGVTGGNVYVPGTGTFYKITDQLVIPDNVNVYGDGYASKIQQFTILRNIFSAGNDCQISRLHLKMITNTPTTTGGTEILNVNAVFINNKNNVLVENNYINLIDDQIGVQVWYCRQVTIKNNIIFGGNWTSSTGVGPSCGDIVVQGNDLGPGLNNFARILIDGNFCLSNNSQGISISASGIHTEFIVTNNVMTALDPSTCTPTGTWTESTFIAGPPGAGLTRRHGVLCVYLQTTDNAPRSIISNNVIRNTTTTGIYIHKQIYGPLLVSSNVISKTGQLTTLNASAQGGIWCSSNNENLTISNNVVDEQKNPYGAGIMLYTSDTPPAANTGAKIVNNYITNSDGHGILIGHSARDMVISGNTIFNSVNSDIKYEAQAGVTSAGGMFIKDNHIKRTNFNHPAISMNQQDATIPSTVCDNVVIGHDKTTGGSVDAAVLRLNCGIRMLSANRITNVHSNTVTNFRVAVASFPYYSAVDGARVFEVNFDSNVITDCVFGFGLAGLSSAVVIPVANTRFLNVTTKSGADNTVTNSGGGSDVTYICDRNNDKLCVYNLNAAPSVGTWVVGDRVEYTTPTAGGFLGAVCTTAGNAGTWKTFGAISA